MIKRAGLICACRGDQDGEQIYAFEDKLTGESLTKENVVVLFAQHRFFDATFF